MKKIIGLGLVLGCSLVFAGCNNGGETSSSDSSTAPATSETKKSESKDSDKATTDTSKTAKSEGTAESTDAAAQGVGAVLTTPWGEQVKVLRILPNGERVISEETSQADINNDGVLTFEELSQTENDMDAQNAQTQNQVGKTLITPWGEVVEVIRILPNGERVISEETSQADINNDGVLTYEELSQTENEMDAQNAQ
ncbi:hypothetical protein [Candidatus Enterococcus moelleringii]|nr:hypothetical protein [Enterococcus sp. 669A]